MRLTVFSGVLILAATLAGAEAPNPVTALRDKDVELQKLLRDREGSRKTDRVKVLINGIFDFEELGRRALGPATWGKMSPAQQARFVKSFREMVENSSVKKLEAYVSDSTRYDAPEIHDDNTSVTTHVFSKGTESIVVYRLSLKPNGWKAWDLVIDDLSTARNYGEQFKKILQKNSMDELIAKLEQKARSEKSGQASKKSGGT